jgi:hypothetical protein
MPEKTPGRSRKRTRKTAAPRAAAVRAAMAKADQYIADQLKAIYDAVAAEPIPDALQQLLDRLESDADKGGSSI